MKLVKCKRCGVEHECAGRMSNVERAKKAAATRVKQQPIMSPMPKFVPIPDEVLKLGAAAFKEGMRRAAAAMEKPKK